MGEGVVVLIITGSLAHYIGTGVVGVRAFSSSYCGSKLIAPKWRYLVPPTSPRHALRDEYNEPLGSTVEL